MDFEDTFMQWMKSCWSSDCRRFCTALRRVSSKLQLVSASSGRGEQAWALTLAEALTSAQHSNQYAYAM